MFDSSLNEKSAFKLWILVFLAIISSVCAAENLKVILEVAPSETRYINNMYAWRLNLDDFNFTVGDAIPISPGSSTCGGNNRDKDIIFLPKKLDVLTLTKIKGDSLDFVSFCTDDKTVNVNISPTHIGDVYIKCNSETCWTY